MAGKMISARLDADTYEKLQEIKTARGISESDAVRQSIRGAIIIPTGDAAELSKEFCKIRILLEKDSIDEKLKGEVEEICRFISDVLQQAEDLIEYVKE